MVGGTLPRLIQALLLMLWGQVTRDRKKIRLVAEGPNKGLGELKELIEAGKVVPMVDRTYPLSKAAEAFRYFAQGRHQGKVVITMETERAEVDREELE